MSTLKITPEILERNGFVPDSKLMGQVGWLWAKEFEYAFVCKGEDGRIIMTCVNLLAGNFSGHIDDMADMLRVFELVGINKKIEL